MMTNQKEQEENMTYTDEINERLGYDADVSDDSQYCSHGTFIGSWWGPDYLCFYCETGETPPTQFQADAATMQRRLSKAKRHIAEFDKMTQAFQNTIPARGWDARFAQALMNCADNEYWAESRWYIHRLNALGLT